MAYKVTKIGKNAYVKSDTTLMDNLLKGIEMKLAARVGILGASGRNRVVRQDGETFKAFQKRLRHFLKSDKAKGDSPTNADIGLAHEVGVKSRNLPRRSWLKEPLEDHLSQHFAKLGKVAIEKMLFANYQIAYAQLGVIGEIIVQKGFETGGYGKWKPLKAATIAAKGSDAILIDTAQLRRSVTSEVVKK